MAYTRSDVVTAFAQLMNNCGFEPADAWAAAVQVVDALVDNVYVSGNVTTNTISGTVDASGATFSAVSINCSGNAAFSAQSMTITNSLATTNISASSNVSLSVDFSATSISSNSATASIVTSSNAAPVNNISLGTNFGHKLVLGTKIVDITPSISTTYANAVPGSYFIIGVETEIVGDVIAANIGVNPTWAVTLGSDGVSGTQTNFDPGHSSAWSDPIGVYSSLTYRTNGTATIGGTNVGLWAGTDGFFRLKITYLSDS